MSPKYQLQITKDNNFSIGQNKNLTAYLHIKEKRNSNVKI